MTDKEMRMVDDMEGGKYEPIHPNANQLINYWLHKEYIIKEGVNYVYQRSPLDSSNSYDKDFIYFGVERKIKFTYDELSSRHKMTC